MPHLTETDLRLLTMLSWSVRAIADAQAATVLGGRSRHQAALVRQLNRMARRRLLTRQRVAVALFVPDAPLVNWLPGLPESNWQSVAWQLQRRWRKYPTLQVGVSWATRKAAAIVGGIGGRLRQPMQLQHDLAVTAVCIARQNSLADDENWLGEDVYRSLPNMTGHLKVPDALIVDDQYRTQRVIELGGLYSPKRLEDFHRCWATQQVPYEIW